MNGSFSVPQSAAYPWPLLMPKAGMIVFLVAVLGVLFVLDILLGSVHIPLPSVVSILLGNGSESVAWEKIVTTIRMPKAITAVVAGAALAVSGLQMQTLFRNPLAGPSVLGISAGASLGVAMVMLASGGAANAIAIRQLGLGGSWLIVIAASLGAMAVLLVVLSVAVRIKDNVVLLIVGIMVGNITVSFISIWQYFSAPEEIQDYLIWTFGSLGGVFGSQLAVLCGVVSVGLLISFATSKPLNVLLLGESYARSLGMGTFSTRVFVILATSLLAGSVTGFCGPIGFIGIAVPHLARSILNTSDHRFLMPTSCLMGAILMLACDIIAQMPGTQTTLPINAVTALIGSPVVIWVIVRQKNLKSSF